MPACSRKPKKDTRHSSRHREGKRRDSGKSAGRNLLLSVESVFNSSHTITRFSNDHRSPILDGKKFLSFPSTIYSLRADGVKGNTPFSKTTLVPQTIGIRRLFYIILLFP